jgi:hypothetical protein
MDIFMATRATITDAWSTPRNLSATLHFPTAGSPETRPSISWDMQRLYYGSDGLVYLSHKAPIVGGSAGAALDRVEKLLTAAPVLEVNDAIKLRAVQRAVDKRAPFHRAKNAMADAILIECYAESLEKGLAGSRFAFVTHNKTDFSVVNGNQKLPQIEWSGAPIEIMYVDCGRTSQVNEAWYRVFSPSLIPDISLLIMQDWRTHRERPRLSYNETYWFTAAHPELEIVHEVKDGGIATFLYRGKR